MAAAWPCTRYTAAATYTQIAYYARTLQLGICSAPEVAGVCQCDVGRVQVEQRGIVGPARIPQLLGARRKAPPATIARHFTWQQMTVTPCHEHARSSEAHMS